MDNNNLISYVGLADCHGIESFYLETELGKNGHFNAEILIFRANANDQRHAVVFKAEIEKVLAEHIKSLCHNGNFRGALRCLKRSAKKNGDGVIVGGNKINNTKLALMKPIEHSQKLWDNIPNSKLDPYYSGGNSNAK